MNFKPLLKSYLKGSFQIHFKLIFNLHFQQAHSPSESLFNTISLGNCIMLLSLELRTRRVTILSLLLVFILNVNGFPTSTSRESLLELSEDSSRHGKCKNFSSKYLISYLYRILIDFVLIVWFLISYTIHTSTLLWPDMHVWRFTWDMFGLGVREFKLITKRMALSLILNYLKYA